MSERHIGDLAYLRNVKELVEAPQTCLRSSHYLSAVKLIYSGIDNLAWLCRRHSDPNVQKRDFVEWVSQYLLPGSKLQCNAEEIYGARCGLLHANIAESQLSRKGKARQIVYAIGRSRADGAYQHIRNNRHKNNVAVHVEDLCSAYLNGVDKLNERLAQCPDFAKVVYDRANKLFLNVE